MNAFMNDIIMIEGHVPQWTDLIQIFGVNKLLYAPKVCDMVRENVDPTTIKLFMNTEHTLKSPTTIKLFTARTLILVIQLLEKSSQGANYHKSFTKPQLNCDN